eukprot:TRINITY_DN1207_c0_g2_i5.p1 TRINITY_DN1207_c0_g2~~TRINITY_DN1207_c0_g2_i5.p1  ORF type:complete len:319 (+),score=107.09 TRINITY_DN1207_c0_g2_i5:36-959(+)
MRNLFVATLLVAFVCQVFGHSFLTCTDYRPPAGLHSGISSEPGIDKGQSSCYARPRNFQYFLQQKDGYTHRPVGTGFSCDPQKQQRTNPLRAAYSATDKPYAQYKPGRDVCVEWPARNHAKGFNGPYAGGFNCLVFMVRVNNGADVNQDQFNAAKVAEFPYSDCSPDGTSNDRPCRGCFKVPANTPVGNYTFQWTWEFNNDEWYSTCWDAEVTDSAPGFTAPKATVGSDKPARLPPFWKAAPLDGKAPEPEPPSAPTARPPAPAPTPRNQPTPAPAAPTPGPRPAPTPAPVLCVDTCLLYTSPSPRD